jgi:hypothetical protein
VHGNEPAPTVYFSLKASSEPKEIIMRNALILSTALFVTAAIPAWAGRAVTDEERTKLVAAVSAQGCTGGKMVWDDPKYEVDDVRCSDGRMYDLSFDREFKFINKKPN